MRGNFHVRFLEGEAAVMPLTYSTMQRRVSPWKSEHKKEVESTKKKALINKALFSLERKVI
jgi:hypothetical protein